MTGELKKQDVKVRPKGGEWNNKECGELEVHRTGSERMYRESKERLEIRCEKTTMQEWTRGYYMLNRRETVISLKALKGSLKPQPVLGYYSCDPQHTLQSA